MRSHHGPTKCGISCELCRFVLGGAPPKLTDIRVVQDPGAKGLKGDDYIHLEVVFRSHFVPFFQSVYSFFKFVEVWAFEGIKSDVHCILEGGGCSDHLPVLCFSFSP